MECNNCGAQMPDEELICSRCGVSVENDAAETEVAEEVVVKKKVAVWKIVLAVVGSLAVLTALAYFILTGAGISLKPRQNDVFYKTNYTVSDKIAQRSSTDVIATVGDYKLTNGEFQIHYWMQVYEFLEYYGSYYFDYTQPLDTQMFSEETGTTWQQYFIDVSIESWRRYALLNMMAEEEGFQLDEESQASLDSLVTELESMAQEYTYDNAEAMIRDDMGAGCTLQDYVSYMKLRNVGLIYFDGKYAELEPTDEEISAYYDANKETFEASGYMKEDQTLVDIRHILIQLADGEHDSYGQANYTEQQWEQCREQAQAVLDAYLANPTEDNFAALAKEYSADGNAEDGGIYTGVKQGQMVEEFDSWIFDESRVEGDNGLVKTVYGYHVMYFIQRETTEGEWVEAASTQLVSEKANELIEEKGKSYPTEVNYKKIVLAENTLG